MTREQFEATYTDYPFNPIFNSDKPLAELVDKDGFLEVAEAPTGGGTAVPVALPR
jgi:hypothetical protein